MKSRNSTKRRRRRRLVEYLVFNLLALAGLELGRLVLYLLGFLLASLNFVCFALLACFALVRFVCLL